MGETQGEESVTHHSLLITHHSSLDPRIAKLLADAEQKWGRGALVRLGDVAESAEVEVIPTGFPALDAALGIGGLPCGRISEVFGPDSSGKQALVASLAAQCQRAEGVVAYMDPAGRLDPEQMEVQGVDFHSLLVAHPRDWLQAMEMAIRLARSGGIRLMVFDLAISGQRSAISTQHPVQLGGHMGQGGHTGPPLRITHHASLITLALRRLVSAVDRNGITFLFVTHQSAISDQQSAISHQQSVVSITGRPHGAEGRPHRAAPTDPQPLTPIPHPPSPTHHSSPITHHSSGGQALRFFASVRLGVERAEWIRRGRNVVGCRSTVRVAKNKLAPPLQEAEVELLFYRFPPAAPPLKVCQHEQEKPTASSRRMAAIGR